MIRYGWGVPRAGQVKSRSGDRLTDGVGVGVLTRSFPPEVVDEVVAGQGRSEQRSRLLAARLVVYYVMALALFVSEGYEEVMRQLVAGGGWGPPGGGAGGGGGAWRR